jgi:hypothetical protein
MTLRISRAAVGDLALVAVSVALTEQEIWTSNDVPGPRRGRALPLLLLLVAPILLRRTAPLLAAALVFCAIFAYSVWHGSPEGIELIVPTGVVAYSVAAHSGRRRALTGLGLMVPCYAIYAAHDPNVTQRGSRAAENEWAAAFFGVVVVVRQASAAVSVSSSALGARESGQHGQDSCPASVGVCRSGTQRLAACSVTEPLPNCATPRAR